jgi:glycerol-3-phosphate acyltransferase PlsY
MQPNGNATPALPPLLWLLLAGAFLLGSIPFGFLAGRMRGIDLREHGSRNIGATNVLRVLGTAPGVTVLLLDALKGYLPAWYAKHIGLEGWWVVATGLCAVLGHIYSPFVRFRGGKGVATSLGVLIALSPLIAGASLLVFVVAVALTRWVALGSILGAITQAVLFCVLPQQPTAYRLFALVVAAFVIFRHRSNIQRMLSGTENRFGAKKTDPIPAVNEKGNDPLPG